jgi:hypothetical protein
MNMAQLRKVLRTAADHYLGDGRRDMADALSSFAANLLKGDDSQTVAAFVSRIKKARKPTGARTARKSSRKR